MVLRCKNYTKGQADVLEVKRVFLFFLEKLYNDHGAKKVTMVFDCSGAGLSNMVRAFCSLPSSFALLVEDNGSTSFHPVSLPFTVRYVSERERAFEGGTAPSMGLELGNKAHSRPMGEHHLCVTGHESAADVFAGLEP